MKMAMRVVMAIVFAFSMSLALEAQERGERRINDNWGTLAECLAQKDSPGAPFYRPSIVSKRRLGKNEEIRGIPYNGCHEMDLPDRIRKRGFVKIAQNTDGVYDKTTGKLLRLAACNNDIYQSAPFPESAGRQGERGPQGERGLQGARGERGERGRDGLNCWDLNENGVKDAEEDLNRDGVVDVRDCKGEKGDRGENAQIEREDSRWGLVASGLVARASSESTERFIGGLVGSDVCAVEGAGVGVGVAHDSGLRLMVTYDTIDAGSVTSYDCDNCKVSNTSQGMTMLGVRAEYVKAFGSNDRSWRPIAGARAGVGTISGNVRVKTVDAAGRASFKDGGPEELFGSKAAWNAAVLAGIEKRAGKWGFEPVVGFEIPRGAFFEGRVVYRLGQ